MHLYCTPSSQWSGCWWHCAFDSKENFNTIVNTHLLVSDLDANGIRNDEGQLLTSNTDHFLQWNFQLHTQKVSSFFCLKTTAACIIQNKNRLYSALSLTQVSQWDSAHYDYKRGKITGEGKSVKALTWFASTFSPVTHINKLATLKGTQALRSNQSSFQKYTCT